MAPSEVQGKRFIGECRRAIAGLLLVFFTVVSRRQAEHARQFRFILQEPCVLAVGCPLRIVRRARGAVQARTSPHPSSPIVIKTLRAARLSKPA